MKRLVLAAVAAGVTLLSGCAVYAPGPPMVAVAPRPYYGPPVVYGPAYYGPSFGFYGRWRR